MIIRSIVALAAAATLVAGPAAAASRAAPPPDAGDFATTHGSVTVAGHTVGYTAEAGTLPLRDAAGNETARMFSVSYLANIGDPRKRPVTFVWNGGPGSSTMWLHLASFAPVRLPVPSNAMPPSPNTALALNPDSLIDATDLVFVDAVGTGYSRITGKGTPEMFYGVDQDAAAFAQFIRNWVTASDRWGAPIFLLGESYGTLRAPIVANLLQEGGISVQGVTLISSVLDFNVLDGGQGPGEDYPYISFLPTEAAVAWYHHLGDNGAANITEVADEARQFAAGPYAAALMSGDQLDAETRKTIVERLHALIGLDQSYIDRANLRIDPSRFEQALMQPQGITTGRLDGRYRGPTLDRTADAAAYDPTTDDSLTDAFVTAFNRYVRTTLNYRVDRPYYGTNYPVVGRHWNFRRAHSIAAPNVLPDLRSALVKNPYLHVFSANGYYDLATPFFGTEYSLNHLGLEPSVHDRVSFGDYPSGHMIYLNDPSRASLRADLERFYGNAVR